MGVLAFLIILMLVMFVLNIPMYISLILPPLIILVTEFSNIQPYLATQQLIAGVSTQALLAVPLFIFGADIM